MIYKFKKHFKNNYYKNTGFYCQSVFFDTEIKFLKNNLNWQQMNNTKVSCLFFDVVDCDVQPLSKILGENTNNEVLFLHLESCQKTTPVYRKIEQYGFHLSFECENYVCFVRPENAIKVLEKDLLDSVKIEKILERSWRRVRNLPKNTQAEVLTVPATALLTHYRFDIAIKALYARLYTQGLAKKWRDKVYSEQAIRVTGVGVEVIEYDGTGKKGIKNFLGGFHSLLVSIESNKIPSVPVDKNLIAFDGSHRIASALVMKRKVNAVRLNALSTSIANSSFFINKNNGHEPCSNDVIDESAIEYCRLKTGLLIALIFPTVSNEKFAIKQLAKIGNIVYQKNIKCTPKMGANLLKESYLGHSWLRPEENNKGFLNKVRACFPYSGIVRVVLIDEYDVCQLRNTKDIIRKYYKKNNHSLHVTDSDEEVIRLSKVVFNHNSLDLLCIMDYNLREFNNKLFKYRDWLESNDLNGELFCVGGSAILSLLGLRECKDIDFLFYGDEDEIPERPSLIDCHNHQIQFYPESIAEIVGNPNFHFWYMGIKFCTVDVILEMKKTRSETKDYKDVSLLLSKINNKYFLKKFFLFRGGVQKQLFLIKRILKYIIRKI